MGSVVGCFQEVVGCVQGFGVHFWHLRALYDGQCCRMCSRGLGSMSGISEHCMMGSVVGCVQEVVGCVQGFGVHFWHLRAQFDGQ